MYIANPIYCWQSTAQQSMLTICQFNRSLSKVKLIRISVSYKAQPDNMNTLLVATHWSLLVFVAEIKGEGGKRGQQEHIALYSNLFTEADPESFLLEC